MRSEQQHMALGEVIPLSSDSLTTSLNPTPRANSVPYQPLSPILPGSPNTPLSQTSTASDPTTPQPSSSTFQQPPPPAPLFSRLQHMIPNHNSNDSSNNGGRNPTHLDEKLHFGDILSKGKKELRREEPDEQGEDSGEGHREGKEFIVTENGEQEISEEDRITGKRDVLKVRFVTWNMHDSIPKGDLTPLLGKVPIYVPPSEEEISSGKLPRLKLDASHPYHLIVIAGQECPVPSGVPMGLSGMKFGKADRATTATPAKPPPTPPSQHSTLPVIPGIPRSHSPLPSVPSTPIPITPAPASSPTPPLSSVPTPSTPVQDKGYFTPSSESSTPAPNPPSHPPLSVPALEFSQSSPNSSPFLTPVTPRPPNNLTLQIPSAQPHQQQFNSSPQSISPSPMPSPAPPRDAVDAGRTTSPEPDRDGPVGPVHEGKEKEGSGTGSSGGGKDREEEREKREKEKEKMKEEKLKHVGLEGKGWSSVLQDWYCNRVGEGRAPASSALEAATSSTSHPPQPPTPSTPGTPSISSEQPQHGLLATEPGGDGQLPIDDVPKDKLVVIERKGSKDSASGSSATGGHGKKDEGRLRVVEEGKGAYEFVEKIRLLGIYMTVYVWRGCRHLVKKTSTSYVTTGLIGGRFGNKGGVAIAIHLAETRLLFVNSHLAAHASRSDVRLMNVQKIKSELEIDCFLEPGDERLVMEDPTDRYDATWWMGDLNFRLDVSRLHADWLISRKEYDQALKFDQLRKIMAEGTGFQGFREAEINFPPTYKYDVNKALKRSSSRLRSRRHRDDGSSTPSNGKSSAVPGQDLIEEADAEDEAERETHPGDETDGHSLNSGWTSYGAHSDDEVGSQTDDGATDDAHPSSHHGHQLAERVGKIFLPSTAIKIKRKFLGLVKPPSSPAPSASASRSSSLNRNASTSKSSRSTSVGSDPNRHQPTPPPPSPSPPPHVPSPTPSSQPIHSHLTLPSSSETPSSIPMSSFPSGRTSASLGGTPSASRSSMDGSSRPALGRNLSNRIRQSFSGNVSRAPTPSDDDSEDELEMDTATGLFTESGKLTESGKGGGGVYDTSAKQRVPSWCDRILWKSHEEDYPEPLRSIEEEPVDNAQNDHPSRLGRIAHALHIRRAPRDRDTSSTHRASSSFGSAKNTPQSTPRGSIAAAGAGEPQTSSIATESYPSSGHVHFGTGSSQKAEPFSRPASLRSSPSASSVPSAHPSHTRSLSNHNNLHHLDLSLINNHAAPSSPSRSRTSPTIPSINRPGSQRHYSNPNSYPCPTHAHTISSGSNHIPNSTNGDRQQGSWFSRLFPLTNSGNPQPPSLSVEQPLVKPTEELIKRRKGEVLALQYGTLDHHDMIQLEGYSDHRPVVGAYLLFI